jgi:tetratricopeptide (TPR) repeat protein
MSGNTSRLLRWEPNRSLPDEVWDRLELILMHFDSAWRRGEQPALEDYLAPDEPERLALLIELVHSDLHFRLRAGEAIRVETYLQRYPELECLPDVVLALVVAEYDLRRREPGASLEEYLRRFPSHEAALRERFSQGQDHDYGSTPEIEPRQNSTPPAGEVGAVPKTIQAHRPTNQGPPVADGSPSPDPYPTRVSASLSPRIPIGPPAPAGKGAASGGWPSVPGYEILGELGRGGMGVVYMARQARLNRVVALKLILAGSRADAEDLTRFYTEAEAIARLQHPNIVQVYEVGEHDGLPYLSLEFCPGGSLAEEVRGKTLPARRAAEVVELLARGMEEAHQRNVIHRDLKPANVLLTAEGQPKITDFGLAKKLDEVGQTVSGQIMGTPPYMAPEQATGILSQVGPATDVYALAAILYELLTGRPPFKAASVWETLDQVRSQDPVPPRRLQPKVPRDLETICLKGLMKQRNRRYGSARELAEDLRRFLDGEPVRARRVSSWERTLKWARRRPAQAALVGALLLAGLVGVAGTVFYGLYERQKALALGSQINRRQKIDRLWGEGNKAEADGQLALDRGEEEAAGQQFAAAAEKWEEARGVLNLEPEAGDESLLRQVEDGRARVQGYLEKRAAKQQLLVKSKEFFDARDEILPQAADPFFGDRTIASERMCRQAAAALRRLGLERDTPPAQAAELMKRWRDLDALPPVRRLAVGCYEVLLIWSEAEAVVLPGEAESEHKERAFRALRLLDLAQTLGEVCEVPNPQAFHVRRARYLTQAGKNREAAEERDLAARLRPTTALDYFLAALDAFQQDKPKEAADACEKAINQQSDSFGDYLGPLYLQAVLQVQAGRWADAQLGLTAYLSRRPDSFGARVLHATALGFLGYFDSAETAFAQILPQAADSPSKYVVLTNRGAMRIRRGLFEAEQVKANPEQAQRFLQQHFEQARLDLEEATRTEPGDYHAYANLTTVYLRRKEWGAAAAAAQAALDRRPPSADLAGLYRTRGRARLGIGNLPGARRDFEQAIALRPRGQRSADLASDYVDLGLLRHKAGEHREALDDYAAALQADPGFFLAHQQQAFALLKLQRNEEAGKALDLFLAKGGRPTPALYRARGLIHSERGENPEALVAFSLALNLEKDKDVETLNDRGWTYLRLNVPQSALADFEAALKREPAHADSLCGRGHARVLLGRVPEAVQDAEAVTSSKNPKPRLVLFAACIYSRAAAQLGARADARSPANQRAIEHHQARALELLVEALRQFPEAQRPAFWQKNVRHESALAAVHNHPGWRRLEMRYGP